MLLWKALARHFLLGTLVKHSWGKLWWDTVGQGESCGLVGLLCGTVLWDTLAGHSSFSLSYGTLLWDTFEVDSCRTLLLKTFAGH